MIQPKIQEVFIRIEDDTEESIPIEKMVNGYFFTPEEFEQFKKEFSKELLEKASENALIAYFNEDNEYVESQQEYKHYNRSLDEKEEFTINIDKESITATLDDYLLNNKI